VPLALLIVATAGFEEDQLTDVVKFCVLPSVNVPVAVNCWLVPRAIAELVGVTAIVTSTAGPTVSVVEPLIVPKVAVMVDEPMATLCASPWLGTLLLMVALVVEEELHVTWVVMFAVLPSA